MGMLPGTPGSSTNKTDCHDITAILLKVALNITILNRLVIQATKFILGFFSSLNLMISVNHILFLFFGYFCLYSIAQPCNKRDVRNTTDFYVYYFDTILTSITLS